MTVTVESLSLADALAIADATLAHAGGHDLCLAVAVLDAGGHLILLHRMDGTQLAASEVAVAKARTALEFRRPSSVFDDASRAGRTALAFLPHLVGGLGLEGGIPVTLPGATEPVGAVGTSGATSEQDADAARAGVTRWLAR